MSDGERADIVASVSVIEMVEVAKLLPQFHEVSRADGA